MTPSCPVSPLPILGLRAQTLISNHKHSRGGTSLVVQWLRLCPPNAEGLSLIPDQGTRSHMLQLKILCAATKWSQINKKKIKERERERS